MSIFNIKNSSKEKDIKKHKLFFGDELGIVRTDVVKYKQIDLLNDKMQSFFWRPQEVNLTKDVKDFRDLQEHEKHIFTSNLKRQILLDSIQGRAPVLAFLPICTSPELEAAILTWSFFESIHNESYSHIIRNVYPDPSVVFDDIMDIKEIVDCANDISRYYDELVTSNNIEYHDYEHKKALWMSLNAVNALEGIRFYVSFACSWAFAETKRMEGNAKIIKFIARDENLHLSLTQKLLKMLPEDDDDFIKIKNETHDDCLKLFMSVVEQEKEWADYLFKDGSMIGLNSNILKEFIEWTANKRLRAIGYSNQYETGSNPLPWTEKWIAGHNVQVAPQESEIASYTIGDMENDVADDTFGDIKL